MAAYTLFDLTYRLARELGVAFEGTATGGAVGTIIYCVYLLGRYEDSAFAAGTAWLIWDAAGAGAAPQGELVRITGFTKATGVVAVTPNFTAAPAAGDRYALDRKSVG